MFSYSGIFYRMATVIYNYLTLNLIFLLCCIPIVTIPAAMAGLFAVSRKFVYKDDPSILRVFLLGFRDNFKHSLVIGTLMFIFTILLWVDYSVAHTTGNRVLLALWVFVLFFVLSFFVHAYTLMVHMDLGVKHLLYNALKMSFIKPILSLLAVALIFADLYVSRIVPILIFTVLFSISATTLYRLINIKFRALSIVMNNPR